MDHGTGTRLWKKKSSQKTTAENDKTGFSSKGNQEGITLDEKLAFLPCECNAHNDFVSIHSSAAQETKSGWEKAKAEAAFRKLELDEALQQKVAERERFYAELKACILQLSYTREEQDERVHEAVMKASKELEKKNKRLEEKHVERSRRVANLMVKNSQLTKALLIKEKLIQDASEQMSQATREFDILMARLESVEKENAFLKYELQILEKELDIRNEETEFNRRTGDALERKHSKSLNKIRKLEAECQSLRVLVQKRLPSPTALGKIKSDFEMQGRVTCEVCNRSVNFITELVCDVEEQNKILKEVAGRKDAELESLRTVFALLASKFSQVEDQLGDQSKNQKSIKLIDGFGSWASALLSQLENLKQGVGESASACRMTMVSDLSQMETLTEMDKLAIVSINTPSSTGQELVPSLERDSIDMESRELLDEKPCDWLQNVLRVILEQTRISKRSIDEILEDIRIALKCTDRLGPTTNTEATKPLPINGSIDCDTSNSLGMEYQVGEFEPERLKLEPESLQESKRLFENQIENQKLINEDLDRQLTASKVQLRELLRKLSSLEVELKDRSHLCEELEATCLELQLQRKSVSSKELVPEDKEEHKEKLVHTGWDISAASEKLERFQETLLNHGKQLRALTSQEESMVFDKVLSKTSNRRQMSQHASLRERMLAEDGVETEDPNSPQTKEIISATERKILHSSSDRYFYEVKTGVPGALAVVPNSSKKQGISLLRKLIIRMKKGGSRKKSGSMRHKSPRQV